MARSMKYCPNYQCVAYGHVVYSQSTRCAFCRWDLKPPRMKSETANDRPTSAPEPAEIPAADARASHRRPAPPLQRTA
jgi:hypothetical protein